MWCPQVLESKQHLMLHLVTQAKPDIPVILTDTGYLFSETYRFIDELSQKLTLKLYSISCSAAPPSGKKHNMGNFEQGLEGIEKYNKLNKVEPMRRALDELEAGTWFSGLRREQSQSRANSAILSIQNGVFKFLPIIDWTNKRCSLLPRRARSELSSASRAGLPFSWRYTHN